VGNGQLASIELVSPTVNEFTINRVSNVVDPDETIQVDPDTGLIIPPDPNGTYSLPYTIIATDPFGAPVPAGTVIRRKAVPCSRFRPVVSWTIRICRTKQLASMTRW
jgi:hypothetical protein